MKTKSPYLFTLICILTGLIPAQSQTYFSDAFNDNSLNPSLWNNPFASDGNGTLAEANMTLQYTVGGGSSAVGVDAINTISFATSWSISFDTFIDTSLAGAVEGAYASLYSYMSFQAGPDNYTLFFGVQHGLSSEFGLQRDPYFALMGPGGQILGNAFNDASLTALRMTYDADTGTLLFEYSPNGVSDDANWVPIPVTDGDPDGLAISPNTTDDLNLSLVANSNGVTSTPGQMFYDNFSVGVVPEPSSAALLLVAAAGLAAFRRRLK